MMKKLVNEIAFMVVLAALGALNLIAAIYAGKWWLAVIGLLGAACAYFAAWLSYRNAQRYAQGIDEAHSSINAQMGLHLHLLKMIFSPESAPEVKTPDAKETEEEHEDTGAPV